MKIIYLFGSAVLFFVPLFLSLDGQALWFCWGLGLLVFAKVSLRFFLGLITLVGGPMLVLPLFDNGHELIGFILIIIVSVFGGYLLYQGVINDFKT